MRLYITSLRNRNVLKEIPLINTLSFDFKTLSVLMYVWITNWRQSFLCKNPGDKYEIESLIVSMFTRVGFSISGAEFWVALDSLAFLPS